MAFLFISSSAPLLPFLPFPYWRGSYRFRLLWCCGAGRGAGRIVGGRRRDLASRSSVPFYLSVPSLRSVRFFCIGCRRVACAVFVSSFSCVICWRRGVSFSLTRYARPFVSSLFSPPRLVGRLVAILCGSPVVSSCSSIRPASRQAIRSRFARASRSSARRASRPAVRFPVLFIVPRCFALPGSSVPRLVFPSRSGVSSSSPYSIVSPGGSSLVSWYRVVFSVSFSSVLVSSHSLRLMAVGMAAARLSHLVAACSRPRCLPSWNPIGLMAVTEWIRRLC